MITEALFQYKKVKIDKALINEMKKLNAHEDITLLIDNILTEYLSNQHNELQKTKELNNESLSDEELVKVLKLLDKGLYCSNRIKFGINESMVGRYEYDYELLDYKINTINKSFDLTVSRKGDVYKRYLTDIIDIKTNGKRIWIYTKKETIHLTCNINKSKFDNLDDDFRTGHSEHLEDIWVYEQYKNTEPLKYNVEKYLYDIKNYGLEIKIEEYVDKSGVKVVFMSTLSEDCSGGDIYTFTSASKPFEGNFNFTLYENSLFIWDMHSVRDSVGIGTHAMKMMIEIAKENGKKFIRGDLSPSDLQDPTHKSRLIHFYKKNGFEIYLDELRVVLSLTE